MQAGVAAFGSGVAVFHVLHDPEALSLQNESSSPPGQHFTIDWPMRTWFTVVYCQR